MAWITDIASIGLTTTSVTDNASSEDRSGQYRVSDQLAVSWAARLTTIETVTTKELDGVAEATAKAWRADNPPTSSKSYGSVDVSTGGVSLFLRIVANETIVTRSISRSNDAGGYRLTETTTETKTTGVNLNVG